MKAMMRRVSVVGDSNGVDSNAGGSPVPARRQSLVKGRRGSLIATVSKTNESEFPPGVAASPSIRPASPSLSRLMADSYRLSNEIDPSAIIPPLSLTKVCDNIIRRFVCFPNTSRRCQPARVRTLLYAPPPPSTHRPTVTFHQVLQVRPRATR
jgi:hypothetical protein